LELFKGDYQKALAGLKVFESKFISTFTILETRLLFSRAAILAEEESNRARFYVEDIYQYSKTKKHLAAISAAYFMAKDGKTIQAEAIAGPAFDKLLRLSKGDFETRMWLFHDAYIYGKTMEMCGNKDEAIRGYRSCIAANPHTALAKKSHDSLRRLKPE
jgi:hypothetical protein